MLFKFKKKFNKIKTVKKIFCYQKLNNIAARKEQLLKNKEESKIKDKEVEEKLLNDIEQELNNILGDKESIEESDKESGEFKEISITLGKKKRRRRRKKKKKKKVAFKEAEDEMLKDFAFRTEK